MWYEIYFIYLFIEYTLLICMYISAQHACMVLSGARRTACQIPWNWRLQAAVSCCSVGLRVNPKSSGRTPIVLTTESPLQPQDMQCYIKPTFSALQRTWFSFGFNVPIQDWYNFYYYNDIEFDVSFSYIFFFRCVSAKLFPSKQGKCHEGNLCYIDTHFPLFRHTKKSNTFEKFCWWFSS